MTRADATSLVVTATEAWASDPASDVVWAGEHEGRRGIRIRQACREATTVWFTIGDHTLGFEAYLLPAPPHHAKAVYRHCLARSYRSWPAAVGIDRDGDLYVHGRMRLAALTATALDEVVAAVFETVELSFPTLVRLGYRPREKSP
jgi:hypothetical protein